MSTIIPHFYSTNLHRTIAYYTNVLYFDLVLDQGELSDQSCMMQFGDSCLIFEEVTDATNFSSLDTSASSFRGKLNIFVDDIQSVFDRICDFADVRRELTETENSTREFSVRDCNGIELVFAEVIPVGCDQTDASSEHASELKR